MTKTQNPTKEALRALATEAAQTHEITRIEETPKKEPAALARLLEEKGVTAPAAPKLFAGGVPLTARITYLAPNPKKPGSEAHKRYALYPTEGTLADVLKISNGPSRADFLYDIRHGHLQVEVA